MQTDDIARLSPTERLALIAELWDSIPEADVPVSDAQRQELERRLASFDADATQSIPWDDLKAELRARKA
jgi:putative addiction module component (TIGR02574 family)